MLKTPYVTARSDHGGRYVWTVVRPGTGASLTSRETFSTLEAAVDAAKTVATCKGLEYRQEHDEGYWWNYLAMKQEAKWEVVKA